jgi:hypothetical protein
MKNMKLGIAVLMLLIGNWISAQTWECSQAIYSSTSKGYEHNGITYFKGNSGGTTTINNNLNQGDCHGSTKSIVMGSNKFWMVCDIDIIGFKVYGNAGTGSNRTGSILQSGIALNNATTSVSTAFFSGAVTGKASDVSCAPDYISVTGIEIPAGTYLQVTFSGNAYVSAIELIPAVSCTPATASFASDEVTKVLGDDPFTNAFTSEENTSDKVYASSNTDIATVDAATGEVTILAVGETTITVTQVADDTYCAVEESYDLTVEAPVNNYTITPTSNNTELGTVSAEGSVITAVPAACSEYGNPAYTLLSGTVTTVVQNGNTFTVLATSDCEIRINFVAKPVYTVTLDAGSGTLAGEAQLTQADCTAAIVLPSAGTCNIDYVFAGWATETVTETTTTPALIPAGNYTPAENITLYAVYSYTDGEDDVLRTWDFEGEWSINAETVDDNLTLDPETNPNRFNYNTSSAATSAPLIFSDGDPITDVAGLLFTYTAGNNRIRLGFAPTKRLYLNGANIAVEIPCSPDNTITIIGESASGSATDRGFSATGGTILPEKCINVSENGIVATGSGVRGTWVYNATGNSLKITTVGDGGSNIFSITVSNSAIITYNSNPECSECIPDNAGAFAEASVTKTIGDEPFTNVFTPGNNTSPVAYGSSSETVATVDAATGEVTILAVGATTITATQAADDTYCAVEKSYNLTVNAPVFAITVESNDVTFGTLTVVADSIITALSVKGYQLAEPAYEITPEGAATIAQDGNVFTVRATADVNVKIMFEALPSSLTWNFSDTEFESKNYDAPTVVSDLTIGPTTTLEGNKKILDGFNFTHRLKLNGSGSVTNRYVSFPVSGDTTITIYGMSASSGKERTLNIADETGVIATFVNSAVESALGKKIVSYAGPATTIYLYSVKDGFNLYAINLTEYVPYSFTAQSNNDEHGTVAVDDNVITATPADNYRISIDNPYTVAPEGSATVTQADNLFTVTDLTDFATITVNFEILTGINATGSAAGLRVQRSNQSIAIVSNTSDPIRQVEIYDLQGRLIYVHQENAATHILRENLNSGVYVVKVFTQNATQNVKLLK